MPVALALSKSLSCVRLKEVGIDQQQRLFGGFPGAMVSRPFVQRVEMLIVHPEEVPG